MGLAIRSSMSQAMRVVNTRVLPEPAPAKINALSAGSVTAAFCCVFYRCTDFYHPEDEGAILFNDANLGIHWPDVGELTVSDKDRRAMSFFEWRKSTL